MQNHQQIYRNVNEAGDQWRAKPGTVRKWAAQRRFQFVRLGRKILIPQSEIDRILDESTIPAHR
jgi:excisionase family DNA binding protein